MAHLIIRRTSEWSNKVSKIGLYLNNKKLGTIGDGETKSFEIDEGEYSLHSKIDWCGSKKLKFFVSKNQVKRISLSGFRWSRFLLPFLIISNLGFFLLKDHLDLWYLIGLVGIGLLYLIYHITIGRNNYLQLKEL